MTQTVVPIPASEGGGGSFDPKDVEITDNTSDAFLIKEGSNEYMRINTSDGTEEVRIENPAVNQQFLRLRKVNANSDFVQLKNGSYSQVYMNRSGGAYNTEVSGTKILNKLVSPSFTGRYQIMANTGSVLIQEVDTNTNFTHTLDQSETGVFKVSSDGSGTPDLFKITSGPTAADERIRIQFTPADRFVELDEGSFNFGCQNATLALLNHGNFNGLIHGNYNFDTYAGGTSFRYHDTSNSKTVMQVNRTGAAFFNLRTNGETFKVKKDTTDVLSIDATSAATYTLEDASSAVFKIVDDNSSPKTYFSATQNGNIQVGDNTGSVLVKADANGLTLRSDKVEFRNGSGNSLATFVPDEFVYNGGGILKNQAYFGAAVDTTSSGTTSIVGQELKINTTFRYDPTNALTNDGVITVKFECDISFYPDGTTPAERMMTFHNKNTTHDATYILVPNTSHGTLNSALGTTDAKAAAIANSGGLTLKPGEYIILRLITLNLTSSTSDARHTISTIGHNIP